MLQFIFWGNVILYFILCFVYAPSGSGATDRVYAVKLAGSTMALIVAIEIIAVFMYYLVFPK